MDLTIFILSLFVLQGICFFIGRKSSEKMTTQEDYFLAGKNISFFPLMMTFVATQVGGGLVLGSAEEAYKYGWAVLLYPLGACLGLILLSLGLGKRMASFQVSTVAQLFEVVYKSKTLKKVASCLSIISLFMIFVAQLIASKKFMLSVGVSSEWIFIGFWAIVILYTALGGLQAVVATDIIQASFFIGAFILCCTYVFLFQDQAWHPAGPTHEMFELNQEKFLGWLLMPLFFMVIEQDMGQRCFSADAPKTVTKATGVAALVTMLICVIPVCLGVTGKSMGVETVPGSSILMTMVSALTNPFITAVVGCAILAAIISTADSLINAISSNLSQDFDLSFITLRTSQKIAAFISILGIFVSYYFTNVVDLLILSYELSVCCLFASVLMALLRRQGNTLSAILSVTAGAASYMAFKFVDMLVPKELLSIALSFAGFYLGDLIASRTKVSEA